MYQSYQQNAQQQFGFGNAASQYRGLQTRYQPVGYVQSQYQSSAQSSSQYASPSAYHTSSYRGNQQDHDAYLRSDSNQPAQSFASSSFASQAPSYNFSSYGAQQQQSFGQQQQAYGQPSFQSYHTANYRGDQPNHDSHLRSDSSQPAQHQFGASFASYGSQFGASQQFSQPQAQSYHAANYRGNQQGHDNYLRSDSSQPAQSQFGSSAANFNRYQF